MGKLEAAFRLTGTFDGLSFYKMKGHDKIIIRRGKGPSRKNILHSPRMKGTRKSMAEFTARNMAAVAIKRGLPFNVAGRNLVGPLNGFLRQVQLNDTTSELGKRNVYLSRYGYCLEGFELSLITPFNRITRKSIPVTIDRKKFSALVQLPAIKPSIKTHPCWRLELSFILAPDIKYGKNKFDYTTEPSLAKYSSPWQKAGLSFQAPEVKLALTPKHPSASLLLIVAIGFVFGEKKGEEITEVKGEGAGRILKVAIDTDVNS